PPLADKMWDIRSFLEKHFVLTRPGKHARNVPNPRKSARRAASSDAPFARQVGGRATANLRPTRLSFRWVPRPAPRVPQTPPGALFGPPAPAGSGTPSGVAATKPRAER